MIADVFYFFLSYGFGYGLGSKAKICQGQTFNYGQRWKLRQRSNTFKLDSWLIDTFELSSPPIDTFEPNSAPTDTFEPKSPPADSFEPYSPSLDVFVQESAPMLSKQMTMMLNKKPMYRHGWQVADLHGKLKPMT